MSTADNFNSFVRVMLQSNDIAYLNQIYAESKFSSSQKHYLARLILEQLIQ